MGDEARSVRTNEYASEKIAYYRRPSQSQGQVTEESCCNESGRQCQDQIPIVHLRPAQYRLRTIESRLDSPLVFVVGFGITSCGGRRRQYHFDLDEDRNPGGPFFSVRATGCATDRLTRREV